MHKQHPQTAYRKDAVSHKPFYNKRRFICDASDSVAHEHQQNVKLAFSGIIFVRLRS